MDREFCKNCLHTGFRETGNVWCGCNYLRDTGECRPRIGDWCLGYEPMVKMHKHLRRKKKDLTEEHARITAELLGQKTLRQAIKTDAAECAEKKTERRTNNEASISAYNGFRMWLNIMMS